MCTVPTCDDMLLFVYILLFWVVWYWILSNIHVDVWWCIKLSGPARPQSSWSAGQRCSIARTCTCACLVCYEISDFTTSIKITAGLWMFYLGHEICQSQKSQTYAKTRPNMDICAVSRSLMTHLCSIQEMRFAISEELDRCEEELDREERFGGRRASSQAGDFRETIYGYK